METLTKHVVTSRVCRSRAVFTLAEFYMEYQLVYSVPTCDYRLFNLKQQQLHEFICQKSVEKCPFHTTASCHHLNTNVVTRQRRIQPIFGLGKHNKNMGKTEALQWSLPEFFSNLFSHKMVQSEAI